MDNLKILVFSKLRMRKQLILSFSLFVFVIFRKFVSGLNMKKNWGSVEIGNFLASWLGQIFTRYHQTNIENTSFTDIQTHSIWFGQHSPSIRMENHQWIISDILNQWSLRKPARSYNSRIASNWAIIGRARFSVWTVLQCNKIRTNFGFEKKNSILKWMWSWIKMK